MLATTKRLSTVGKAVVVLLCVGVVLFTFYEGRVHPSITGSPPTGVRTKVQEVVLDQKRDVVQATPPTLVSTNEKPKDPNAPWIERVAWEPRVFVYHNFLTADECAQIIELAGGDITRSMVVASKGQSAESEWRTSKGVFLTRQYMEKSPLLRNVERRIAEWTQLPLENGEAFYLLRYDIGQQYRPHHDFFANDESGKQFIGNSGNRYATVLTYLKTPDEGGETHFPERDIKVNARAGDSVLFFDMHPTNTPDGTSLHAGLPVVKGVKWAMTKWIRENKTWNWFDGVDKSTMDKWNKEEEEFMKQRANTLQQQQQKQ